MANQTHVVAKGKTKELTQASDDPFAVDVSNANQITALDGGWSDSFVRKGEFSTHTNDNVFRLLKLKGVPTAYQRRLALSTFRAEWCAMLPYEVVAIRQVAKASSFRKREPSLAVGTRFEQLRTAFFLKTTGKVFKSYVFEKDDPYITSYGAAGIEVCMPHLPLDDGNSRTFIPADDVYGIHVPMHPFHQMELLTQQVFWILERAWKRQGFTLCDLKIEFGINAKGELVVADVIDNDSWRLLNEKGEHLDKQRYRDKDTSLEVVAALYEEVAARTEKFTRIGEVEWFSP